MVIGFVWRIECYDSKDGEWHVCTEIKDRCRVGSFLRNLKESLTNTNLGKLHGWGLLLVLFIHSIIFNVCFGSGMYGWWRACKTEVQPLNWYDITPIAFQGSKQATWPSPVRKRASSLNGRGCKVFKMYTSVASPRISKHQSRLNLIMNLSTTS